MNMDASVYVMPSQQQRMSDQLWSLLGSALSGYHAAQLIWFHSCRLDESTGRIDYDALEKSAQLFR